MKNLPSRFFYTATNRCFYRLATDCHLTIDSRYEWVIHCFDANDLGRKTFNLTAGNMDRFSVFNVFTFVPYSKLTCAFFGVSYEA
jgi:hypothetical protein